MSSEWFGWLAVSPAAALPDHRGTSICRSNTPPTTKQVCLETQTVDMVSADSGKDWKQWWENTSISKLWAICHYCIVDTNTTLHEWSRCSVSTGCKRKQQQLYKLLILSDSLYRSFVHTLTVPSKPKSQGPQQKLNTTVIASDLIMLLKFCQFCQNGGFGVKLISDAGEVKGITDPPV